MDNQISNQNKKPIALILIFIASIVIVGLVGYYIGTEFNKYKTAFDELFPPLPDEIFSITGTIIAVDDSITLEIASLEERILLGEEPKIEERVVSLNSETKIVEQTFTEILDEGILDIQETPIELSNLNVGEIITVEANENIKTKKEFTASKIILFK